MRPGRILLPLYIIICAHYTCSITAVTLINTFSRQGVAHADCTKVITTYRRKRILVCLLVALLTLTTTLVIRFISQRSLNQQRVQMSTNKMVAAMDNILRPLAAQHVALLHLVNKPCQDVHLTLRKLAASLQTVRSIALVQSNLLYCSSILANATFRYTSYSRHYPPITPAHLQLRRLAAQRNAGAYPVVSRFA